MRHTKLMATLLVAGMLFTGCGIKNSKAIIKINNETITQKEFDQMMDKQLSNSPLSQLGGGDLAKNKDSMFYLMTEKTVLNHLIVKTILEEEVNKRGIKVTNKELEEAIDKIIDKMGSKEMLTKTLKQNGVEIKDFKEDVKTQVKLRKLAHLTADTKVTDKDVKDFYEKNKPLFTHGEQVRAYHILLSNNPAQIEQEIAASSKQEIAPEELKKRVGTKVKEVNELAKKLSKELQQDNSKFPSYAKQYSQDYMSAQRGGDLGYFEKERMVPAFSKAAFSAKPNTVTDPVQTEYGLHIIWVTDRKAAGTEPFDKIKSDIKEKLTTDKEIKALDDIMIAAKKKAKIEYLDDQYNLDKVEEKLNKQMKNLQDSLTGSNVSSSSKK